MIKFLFLSILSAAILVACNSKGHQSNEMATETATDSAFLINDSTIGNIENITYTGVVPQQGTPGTAYTIVLQQVTGDSIGTYTMTMEPINPKTGKVDAVRDSGIVVTVIGDPNKNGEVIYQLISANPEHEKKHFVSHGDSLKMVDKNMKPISKPHVVLKKSK